MRRFQIQKKYFFLFSLSLIFFFFSQMPLWSAGEKMALERGLRDAGFLNIPLSVEPSHSQLRKGFQKYRKKLKREKENIRAVVLHLLVGAEHITSFPDDTGIGRIVRFLQSEKKPLGRENAADQLVGGLGRNIVKVFKDLGKEIDSKAGNSRPENPRSREEDPAKKKYGNDDISFTGKPVTR